MALTNNDLLVVQQGNSVYKLPVGDLSTQVLTNLDPTDLPIASAAALGAIRVGNNLSIDSNTGILEAVIPAAINFKGQIAANSPAPTAAVGDMYLFSTAGTLDGTWGNAAGTDVQINDGIVFEANGEWDHLPGLFGAGVTGVSGTLPITVGGTASTPVIGINNVTDTTDGAMTAADKAKLDNIQDGAKEGTVTEVTGAVDSGITVATGTSTPVIGLNHATTGAYGSVVLADASALSAGTAGAVVDAQAYKIHDDRLDAIEALPLTVVQPAGNSAIDVTEAPDGTFTVSISDASESEKGAIQLATSAEVEAGVVTDKVVTPFQAAAYYLPQDFSSLNSL